MQGRLTIAVDLRAGVQDAATLEATLSAAASVAMAGIRNRVHVRVVTTSGIDTGFGASAAAHGAAILDLLAAAGYPPGDDPDRRPAVWSRRQRPAGADHHAVGSPMATCRRPLAPAAGTGSPWSSSNGPGRGRAARHRPESRPDSRVVVVAAGGLIPIGVGGAPVLTASGADGDRTPSAPSGAGSRVRAGSPRLARPPWPITAEQEGYPATTLALTLLDPGLGGRACFGSSPTTAGSVRSCSRPWSSTPSVGPPAAGGYPGWRLWRSLRAGVVAR